MYTRLAFAVAAHLEPEILVVDEVLAVGDAAFQKKCMGKMGAVSKEGRTVLFVSHNMAAIEQLCSRAILLCQGKLERIGEVKSVVEYYLAAINPLNQPERPVLAQNASGSVRLLAIQPVGSDGRPVPAVQCGRDLVLRLAVQTDEYLPSVTVSVGIDSLEDARLSVLHSEIAGYELALTPGEHSILCEVPELPLTAGVYALDAKIYTRREVVLAAARIASLTVEASDFYRSGKLPEAEWGGFVHLRQKWTVRDNSRVPGRTVR
jgi:lipopolysaccharide transport system ATP-binding protein